MKARVLPSPPHQPSIIAWNPHRPSRSGAPAPEPVNFEKTLENSYLNPPFPPSSVALPTSSSPVFEPTPPAVAEARAKPRKPSFVTLLRREADEVSAAAALSALFASPVRATPPTPPRASKRKVSRKAPKAVKNVSEVCVRGAVDPAAACLRAHVTPRRPLYTAAGGLLLPSVSNVREHHGAVSTIQNSASPAWEREGGGAAEALWMMNVVCGVSALRDALHIHLFCSCNVLTSLWYVTTIHHIARTTIGRFLSPNRPERT